MATDDESDQHALRLQAYTLSRVRIFEQVLINALSALAIGALAGVGSLLLLLFQRIANFVIVPTNLLMAIVFLGLGALIMLVITALSLYTALRRAILRSNAFAFAVLFGLFGYAIGSKMDLDAIIKGMNKKPSNTEAASKSSDAEAPTPTGATGNTDSVAEMIDKRLRGTPPQHN